MIHPSHPISCAKRAIVRSLRITATLLVFAGPFAFGSAAQQPLIAASAGLPEAPSALLFPQAASQQALAPQTAQKLAPGSVSGTVSDAGAGLVPHAQVQLLHGGHGEPRVTTSDADGRFAFTGVGPGSYRIVITAPGLQPFESAPIVLTPGQAYELPATALVVASTSTTVDVVETRSQVADAEVKLETQQRVLGIVPNFYTSFLWDAAPLNVRQKGKLALVTVVDPVTLMLTAGFSGAQYVHNSYPEYGDGPEGYGKRFGANYADQVLSRGLSSFLFPSVFRQDPRYFYMGPNRSFALRLRHALLAGVVTKGNNGKWQPNFASVAGHASAGAISTIYRPSTNTVQDLVGLNVVVGIVGTGIQGLFREFVWPSFTPKVPNYVIKGKPPVAPEPATTTPAPANPTAMPAPAPANPAPTPAPSSSNPML